MALSNSNVLTAEKYKIDTKEIETKVDTEKNVKVLGNDLTFLNVRESERTKHVHRLHPYLGKFVPQLVEVFLNKYFKPGDTVVDPFCGSGTTLIEANALGINSIGIELSEFNALITRVKIDQYNYLQVEKEIKDAMLKVDQFSKQIRAKDAKLAEAANFETNSEYLNTWFAKSALQEILFYKSIIKNYKYKDILKVILSRAARSSRLITHYELARPKAPITKTYWCIKHRRECKPTENATQFIDRYSYDTIYRLNQFSRIRTNTKTEIIQGDSRFVKLDGKFDGIFTSPPYVGVIDYHDQHQYAYELFDMQRLDEKEIGPAKQGQSNVAKIKYVEDISAVFNNMKNYLKPDAKIFIVANDKFGLYPEIGRRCGFYLIDTFNRPVLMRTERTGKAYFESIFYFKLKS